MVRLALLCGVAAVLLAVALAQPEDLKHNCEELMATDQLPLEYQKLCESLMMVEPAAEQEGGVRLKKEHIPDQQQSGYYFVRFGKRSHPSKKGQPNYDYIRFSRRRRSVQNGGAEKL